MGLRKGKVAEDVKAAAEETPPFTPDAVPTSAVEPAPAPAPAVAPVTTEPVSQNAAANVVATQAAPAPAPVAVVNPPAQLPATRAAGAIPMVATGVQAQLEFEGFAGLNFGFGSFPMISLQNNGQFQSSEGGSLGTEFYVSVLGSVPKWIYKNNQKGPAEDFFYTFDKITAVNGESCESILDGWRARGWQWELKQYLDVQAQLVTNDEDNGCIVLLSVPPTSIAKFSGYIATVRGRHNKNVKAVITRVYLGELVTKVKHPFHPWAFAYHGDMPQQ